MCFYVPIKMKTNEINVICGQRGKGKTTLAIHICKRIRRKRILDILGEYSKHRELKRFCYIPRSKDDIERFLNRVWRDGNVLLIIDEADLIFPNKIKLRDIFYKIIHLGRHRNIGLLAITRRIANLHKDIVSLADTIFIFRLIVKSDLDYLRYFIGDDIFLAQDLEDYHFLVWHEGKIEKCEPVKIRSNWGWW